MANPEKPQETAPRMAPLALRLRAKDGKSSPEKGLSPAPGEERPRSMHLLERVKYKFGHILESNPYTWWMAWTALHYFPLLLPHDSSYFALKFFRKSDPQQKLFLDIGANSGISALSFRRLNVGDPIFSVEPNPIHGRSLERLKKRLDNFDYRLVAAGSKPGQLRIYMPQYGAVPLHTFAAGSEEQVRSGIKKSFPHIDKSKTRILSWAVDVATIDSLELVPAIIKVDAEGSDFDVLLGATETIAKWRPFIMFEACHDDDMGRFSSFFAHHNYRLMVFDQQWDRFHPFASQMKYQSGSRNIFAVPEEELKNIPTAL